jgi:hypothetical protein
MIQGTIKSRNKTKQKSSSVPVIETQEANCQAELLKVGTRIEIFDGYTGHKFLGLIKALYYQTSKKKIKTGFLFWKKERIVDTAEGSFLLESFSCSDRSAINKSTCLQIRIYNDINQISRIINEVATISEEGTAAHSSTTLGLDQVYKFKAGQISDWFRIL